MSPKVAAALLFAVPLAVGIIEAIRLDTGPPPPDPGFLWNLLLEALPGAGPERARILSLLAWAGLLAVLVVHVARAPAGRWPGERRDLGLMLPVAAWGVALHRGTQWHASAGDDTSLLALLLAGGLLLLVNHPRQGGLAAAVYAIAVLVRPEALLFTAPALAYVLWRFGAAAAVRFAAVWSALVMPYMLWNWHAVGRLLPEARVAAPVPLRRHAALLAGAAGALAGWIVATWRGTRRDPRLDLVLVALVQVALAVALSARAGGDRSLVAAVTPLLYLGAEDLVRITGRRVPVVALAALVIGGTLAARILARP